MTETLAVIVIAVLSVLRAQADQRRLDDAFQQLTAAQRQLRAQADPQTFVWTEPPAAAAPETYEVPETFWLTDASGLLSVEVER